MRKHCSGINKQECADRAIQLTDRAIQLTGRTNDQEIKILFQNKLLLEPSSDNKITGYIVVDRT